MNHRNPWIPTAVAFAILFSALSVAGQTTFKFKPVVRAGDPAPVPPRLGSILEVAFNDQGQLAAVADGGLLLKSGNQITRIAAPGDFASNGAIFASFTQPAFGPQGQVAVVTNGFLAAGVFQYFNGEFTQLVPDGAIATNGDSVTPGSARYLANGNLVVSDAFTGALYLFSGNTLTRLVGPGDAAPDGGAFIFLQGYSANSSGQIVFFGFSSTGSNGIFLLSGGTISKIISSGDPTPHGGNFLFGGQPSINDSGEIVFTGNSTSIFDSGIFVFSNGNLSVPVSRLATLPDGSSVNVVITTSLNNAGQIAFTAVTTAPGNDTAVFLFSNGQITTVATTGEPTPDGGTFVSETVVGANINSSGQVLFFGEAAHHGPALYLFSAGLLSHQIGQGDLVPFQPTFEFPTATAIGAGDRVLISDNTFPGGHGGYVVSPVRGNTPGPSSLGIHIGEEIGVDGFVNFLFGFSMNHRGEVASAVASSDANGTLLLTRSGVPAIVADSAPDSAIAPDGGVPAINGHGEIVATAVARSTLTRGVYLFSGSENRLLLDPSAVGLGPFAQITNLVANNAGQIAFMAQGNGPTGIFTAANGVVTPLAISGAPAPGGGNFLLFLLFSRQAPVMNDNGDVAFAAALPGTPGGFFGAGGIFLYRNGVVSRIVGFNDPSPDGGVFRFADAPSINSSGDVAFFAETSQFSFGAFVWSNGHITQVAVAGDTVNNEGLGFVDLPILNDNGHVAFTANLFNGENAIFMAAPRDDNNSAQVDWVESTPGLPQRPERILQIREWNDKVRAARLARPSGQNAQPAGQPVH